MKQEATAQAGKWWADAAGQAPPEILLGSVVGRVPPLHHSKQRARVLRIKDPITRLRPHPPTQGDLLTPAQRPQLPRVMHILHGDRKG